MQAVQSLLVPQPEHVSSCWETPFAKLVRQYKVSRLARAVEVDITAVYQWVHGSVTPRPLTALAVVLVLRRIGPITLEDVYLHYYAVTGEPLPPRISGEQPRRRRVPSAYSAGVRAGNRRMGAAC
jgi:hypothetical protein